MPVIVRQNDIAQRMLAHGCIGQSLLNAANTGSDVLTLDRLVFEAQTELPLVIEPHALGFLLVMSGAVQCTEFASNDHCVVLLPGGCSGAVTAGPASELLLLQIPHAGRFDAQLDRQAATAACIDWAREPVLASEHDARERIYLATPKLLGTKALKGERIRYPAGTSAPEHQHLGAEHFQYIVAGRGYAVLDGNEIALAPGDIVYNYENEPHYFYNSGPDDFIFTEFFVPGQCRTVWSPGAKACAWIPTGVDSRGRPPARDLISHRHGDDEQL